MDYQGTIIRPPSEANSIILQITTGCSHNKCTFCGAYTNTPFTRKNWEIIEQDIAFAERWCKRQKTVFLADGDALALPHDQILHILHLIRHRLPWVRRVSSYATAQNIARKTDHQLAEYRSCHLQRLYVGLESGLDQVLSNVCKGVSSQDIVDSCQRIRRAEIFLSVTCLLGLGGKALSDAHAEATATVLKRIKPNQVAILTLMLIPGTPLYTAWQRGNFQMPDQYGLLRELSKVIQGLDTLKTQFYANHASNYFDLQGRLPRDRTILLARLDSALAGREKLKPEQVRRL
ncbi:MAG: radical SAM protein [Desulfobulbus propionicus]|nr:MAG: radical SAM protein [Desulfobulbus propionicus]